MFPVKRHRGTSPSAPAAEYELSIRRQHHSQRELDFDDYSQQNRSVRGPSLAPTTRQDLETERRGRSVQRHQDIKLAREDAARSRSMQFTRSWHNNPPGSWPNTRGDDDGDQDMLRDSFLDAGETRASSASLPGLSQLMQKREAAMPAAYEDVPRRAQDMARSNRPRIGENTPFHEPGGSHRPGLAPFIARNERFRSSIDSEATSPASMGMRDSLGSTNSDELPIHPFPGDQKRSAHVPEAPYARDRANSASSNDSMQSTASPSFGASSAFPLARTMAKSSRYLREIDRRNILQRIKNGEKQATLAKEYQVSRAAICNLNKHREVVLSRKNENPLAKHPKKPRPKGDTVKSKSSSKGVADLNDVSPGVHEVRSRAAIVLMTILLDHLTPTADFKRAAYRLLRLVVEEAISLVPLKRIQVAFANEAAVEGVAITTPFCGVAMKASGGGLLLQVFRELEPHRATGSIRVARGGTVDTELPPALSDHNVFLFDLVMTSSEATCLAVSNLVARGAKEEMVWLVTVSISVPVAEAVIMQFPNIKIVTAQMDRSSLHADQATRSVSSDAIRCLVKRFLDSFASPRNLPASV